jgi:hypothetical protein
VAVHTEECSNECRNQSKDGLEYEVRRESDAELMRAGMKKVVINNDIEECDDMGISRRE